MAFQSPKGTRDFFPTDMALRRFIEDTWRRVSLRHGFVEVDGPTFEFLDLYKVKSGDEIVSQLFHFESREDKAGKTDSFALRPEFTPTLARMIAARANALPRPIKWFSIPRCYRAERPQKGRLREFIQWNVDMLGGETPEARRQFDLEVAALCLDCLRDFGLTSSEIQLLWNDRQLVEDLFKLAGVPVERYPFAFHLLDRISKLSPDQRSALHKEHNVTDRERAFFEQLAAGQDPIQSAFWSELPGAAPAGTSFQAYAAAIAAAQTQINSTLTLMGLPGFAKYDASIVRGLAYYTGFVWEIADTKAENRAVAGGGRYDKLIEMFGGPSLPATGFGMGDVVVADVLQALGKLPPIDQSLIGGQPEVFIINALESPAPALQLAAQLRASTWDPATKKITRPGIATALSYKASKNIGKQMPDASASGARLAVILAPAEFAQGHIKLKDLQTREEEEIPLALAVPTIQEFFRGTGVSPVNLHLRHTIQRARRHSNEFAISPTTNPLQIIPAIPAPPSGPQISPGQTHLPISATANPSTAKIHPTTEPRPPEMHYLTVNPDTPEEATFFHLIRRKLGKE